MNPENISAIYPLTPTQQGMLLHTLMHPGTGMYLQQFRYVMVMENLNLDAFAKAWQAVVDRHEILRTAFVHEGQQNPLQVVLKSAELPFDYLDFSTSDESTQQQQIEQILLDERQQGLPFNKAPLMRVRMIYLGQNRYQFVRSYHHILMDAWCFSIVMVDFLQFYQHFCGKGAAPSDQPARFEDYVQWLEQQPQQSEFWQQKLQGFDTPTDLGIYQPNRYQKITQNQAISADVSTRLSEDETKQLQH
ncbi:MAG: condensation domain-containing protein, partial [Psychrosphaera sp.]|nr:condensation domain-containing protein [Psychrosphaera sp.]